LKKCSFGKSQIRFIGHIVGSGQITVIQDKVEAIRTMPLPTTKKALRSFIGMASFYRSFIPHFSELALPLTDMTGKKQPNNLCFNDWQKLAFERIKDELCNSAILYTPRYDRGFIIQCDASEYAVGGCLSQLNDDGNEQPVAFCSAKLTDVQKRWSVIEREAYACIFALNKFDVFVVASSIILYTDHNPLKFLVDTSPKSSKLQRWAMSLSRYDITIRHKSGAMNSNADCLSRLI